jgi:hypothetical protein
MPSEMSAEKKKEYRELLYHAFLMTRMLCYGADELNLSNKAVQTKVKDSMRTLYAMSEALHNLAEYSACEFEGFDETKFREIIDEQKARYDIDLDKILLSKM